MIDSNALLQLLQSLHQRNAQPDAGINSAAPISPGQLGTVDYSKQQQKPQPSMLGYLGGLGDTKNAQGGYDPSWATQANQFLTGNSQEALPWNQPISQQMGQNALSGGMNSGIIKFLSSLF